MDILNTPPPPPPVNILFTQPEAMMLLAMTQNGLPNEPNDFQIFREELFNTLKLALSNNNKVTS